MERSVREYLSSIGRRGGRKSRRNLDSAAAKEMVRVREARRAFKKFYARCFWSCSPDYHVTAKDIPWVTEQLLKYGDRNICKVAMRLCR